MKPPQKGIQSGHEPIDGFSTPDERRNEPGVWCSGIGETLVTLVTEFRRYRCFLINTHIPEWKGEYAHRNVQGKDVSLAPIILLCILAPIDSGVYRAIQGSEDFSVAFSDSFVLRRNTVFMRIDTLDGIERQ